MKSTASMRTLVRILVVAVGALAVACGNDESDPIVVGAGDSAESILLAEIYSGALARTGADTVVEAKLGNRADYLAALDAGRVALVGEHTGELLAHYDAGATERVPGKVAEALSKSLPEGLVVSDPAEGADMRPRVLISTELSERDAVESVGDLADRCPAATAGAVAVPGPLPPDGAATRIAACDFAGVVRFADPGAARKALLDGKIQAIVAPGPPELTPGIDDRLTVLSDDKYAVRAENVLPLFRKGVLDERRIKKLNYVAGELTTADLAEMIVRVREGAAPAELARTWLDDHAL